MTQQNQPTDVALQRFACLLQVVRTRRITPHMLRVTLGGEEIAGFPEGREGSQIKILLPRAGQVKPIIPTYNEQGGLNFPAVEQRAFARSYTLRSHRPAEGEIDVDFVLHGDEGIASGWAARAKPGDYIGIAIRGGQDLEFEGMDWILLAGDETALPVISAILERLPASMRGLAFVEVADAAEEQRIAYQAQVTLNWLHRNDVPHGKSTLLQDAIRNIQLPDDKRVFAWVAGENTVVKGIRAHWRETCGLDRECIYAAPYWRAGLDEDTYHTERRKVMDEFDAN